MALEIKLSRTAINSTGTEMYISDVTGDYDISTNPGGWGGSNPARAATALVLKATLHKIDGSMEAPVVTYNPLDVTSITVQTEEDGYYEIQALAIPNTVPTVEGEYGMDNGAMVVLEGGTLKPVDFDTIYSSSTLPGYSLKTVLLARVILYRQSKTMELVQLLRNQADDRGHNRDIDEKRLHVETARAMYEGAHYQWCLGLYTNAQEIVESFNEIIKEYEQL